MKDKIKIGDMELLKHKRKPLGLPDVLLQEQIKGYEKQNTKEDVIVTVITLGFVVLIIVWNVFNK